jgi:hypothetical protein
MILIANEDPTLHSLTQQKFKAAFRIFDERTQLPDDQDGRRLMCSIYDIFAGPESLNHNCLGCNFDELTDQILKFLFLHQNTGDLFATQQSVSIYFLLLNSIWERMSDVFKIISLPESYRVRYYGAFIRARRWANFFKHPKAFAWMVHHPLYTFENSDHSRTVLADQSYLKVDDEFIKKYYATESSKGLTGEFSGHENKVVVVLPDIERLTTEICDCLQKFIEIVTENRVYKEILDEKSTIVDYLSRQDDM